MNVLLINPNRYRVPPVPPIGLEYLVSPLVRCGHDVAILDLCFSEDVFGDCERAMQELRPAIAGITIRNIDTALYPKTEFFLDDIRAITGHIKAHGIPVIAGGAGFTAMPEQILDYIGADYGVAGPGEGALPELLRNIECGNHPERLLFGRRYRFDGSLANIRMTGIDYDRYFQEGGIAGFETQKGCPATCVYCIEARTTHSGKNIESVIREIESVVNAGYRDFHLCDCEFNIDLDLCMRFLGALIERGPAISWSLYLKPEPVSERLFALLAQSGAGVVTLTVNGYEFKNPEYVRSVAGCIRYAGESGLSLAVDLLMGMPFESVESMRGVLDFFRENRPRSVGLNYHIRLYPGTALMNYYARHPEVRKHIIGYGEETRDLLFPAFYRNPVIEEILEHAAGDALFRIEGLEAGTNYQRFNTD